LEHKEEKKLAILICDKHAFEEDGKIISDWLEGAKFRMLTSNDVYGNYEITLAEKFNGFWYKPKFSY
jgi:hypothetical protein